MVVKRLILFVILLSILSFSVTAACFRYMYVSDCTDCERLSSGGDCVGGPFTEEQFLNRAGTDNYRVIESYSDSTLCTENTNRGDGCWTQSELASEGVTDIRCRERGWPENLGAYFFDHTSDTTGDYLYFLSSSGQCSAMPACNNNNDCLADFTYPNYGSPIFCTSTSECNFLSGGLCRGGICSIIPEEVGAEYCMDSVCTKVACTTDTECPENDICFNGACTIFIDNDNDNLGYVKAAAMDYFLAAYADRYDCDDLSALCTTDCVNTDPSSDSDGGSNVYRDEIPDCRDFCVDHDGDESCDPKLNYMSSQQYVTLNQDSQLIFQQLNFQFGLVHTDGYYAMAGYSQFIDLLKGGSSEDARKIISDCNDNEAAANPFMVENDLCNRIDDDCDYVVDECTDSDEVCVYTISPPSCRKLDFDGDGYNNKLFECSNCNDCNDGDVNINPGIVDCVDGVNCLPEVCAEFDGPCTVTTANGGDDNCNGIADDGADTDEDGTPDSLEDPGCEFEGPINGDRSTINPATGCLNKPGGWVS